MRIARTIESFYPYVSGPANQAYTISEKLLSHGISSKIFCSDFNAKKLPKHDTVGNIKVERFSYKLGFMKYFVTPGIKKAIISYKPTLVHAHNYRNYQAEAGQKAAKALNIPFIISTHGSLIGYSFIVKKRKHLPYKAYDFIKGKKLVEKADAIIVSSEKEKKEALIFGADEKKLYVVPMGIDLSKYKAIEKLRHEKELRLLFVGRICQDRNVLVLLKALEVLQKEGTIKAKLRVIGEEARRSSAEKPGYYQMLKDYAKKKGLNVEFPGAKYGEELIKEYRSSDIFLYCSVWENFGQTMLEAAAAGLPIIATDTGIAQELIINGKTGYIVGNSDMALEHEIAEKIKAFASPAKREEAEDMLTKLVDNKFGWQDIVQSYERIYLKCLEKYE